MWHILVVSPPRYITSTSANNNLRLLLFACCLLLLPPPPPPHRAPGSLPRHTVWLLHPWHCSVNTRSSPQGCSTHKHLQWCQLCCCQWQRLCRCCEWCGLSRPTTRRSRRAVQGSEWRRQQQWRLQVQAAGRSSGGVWWQQWQRQWWLCHSGDVSAAAVGT